jgi:hypothetical protein
VKDKLKDKMKKKFTDLSISHKMLMVYITFASAFLLIALGLTQISFRIYSKELYDKSLQELDYFSQNVNRGLKDAERNNYSISMDALVQRTLSDLSVLEYPSLDYNQKIRDLRRILLNEYDPESCVKSIIFVDLYGNTVEVGTAAWDVSCLVGAARDNFTTENPSNDITIFDATYIQGAIILQEEEILEARWFTIPDALNFSHID